MRAKPTEHQAARAARQLSYHRRYLEWILEKIQYNEALLALYLDASEKEKILPGGFRVRLNRKKETVEITVEELGSVMTHQLVFRIEDRKSA